MIKRVVIAGSRHFNDYEFFSHEVDECLSEIGDEYEFIILSGHCSGVDMMAERYAEEHSIKSEIYPADWKRFGRAAGPKRNKQMVDNADIAIAFSSGGSGTESLIRLALQNGISVYVIDIREKINNI